MGFEIFEDNFDSFFELGIVSLAPFLRIEGDFDVRSNANVFHFPFSVHSIDRHARGGNHAPVHECGIISNPDETTPRPGAYKLSNPGPAEIPRHRVSAGSSA